MTSEAPYAIYRRPGKYVVKRFEHALPGLWAILGPEYTRDTAQALADKLAEELPGRVLKRLGREYGGKGDSPDVVVSSQPGPSPITVTSPGSIDDLSIVPVVYLTIEEAEKLSFRDTTSGQYPGKKAVRTEGPSEAPGTTIVPVRGKVR